MKEKKNQLLEAIIHFFENQPRGRVLDIGCGRGDYSKRLKDLGFDMVASDIDASGFGYKNEIPFQLCDVTKTLPFGEGSFDYVLLLEVIEHLRNPYLVLPELNRLIKKPGSLILSTPNILNLKSRIRYLFEGAYEYFREPPLDQIKNPREVVFQLHVVPYRYHELEFLLASTGFAVEKIATSVYEGRFLSFLIPFIQLQSRMKERRDLKKGSLDYRRINKILLSKEILLGKHLIVSAKKNHDPESRPEPIKVQNIVEVRTHPM